MIWPNPFLQLISVGEWDLITASQSSVAGEWLSISESLIRNLRGKGEGRAERNSCPERMMLLSEDSREY